MLVRWQKLCEPGATEGTGGLTKQSITVDPTVDPEFHQANRPRWGAIHPSHTSHTLGLGVKFGRFIQDISGFMQHQADFPPTENQGRKAEARWHTKGVRKWKGVQCRLSLPHLLYPYLPIPFPLLLLSTSSAFKESSRAGLSGGDLLA